jgi:ABC-type transport system substrate-binding protein
MSYWNGTLWVSNQDAGTVTGIDAVTGKETTYRFGHPTAVIAAGPGVLLVGLLYGRSFEDRINQLTGKVARLFVGGLLEPIDPAVGWDTGMFQVDYATCAKLVNYPDEPAPGGWQLRPEIAAAMPEVSPDRRTYTFTIRPGYRFSPPSGQEVTAETFLFSIERALSAKGDNPPGPQFIDDIQGEGAFLAHRVAHVSGLRAEGDRLSITLVKPSPDFLERLAMPFFCPVPTDTPPASGASESITRDTGNGHGPFTVPSAGPYYVADYLNEEYAILKPNPNYPGPRAADARRDRASRGCRSLRGGGPRSECRVGWRRYVRPVAGPDERPGSEVGCRERSRGHRRPTVFRGALPGRRRPGLQRRQAAAL